MPDLLLSVEIAVGVVLGLAVAYLALTYLRRRTIGLGKLVTICGLRMAGGRSWRGGMIRFGVDELEWFPLDGLSLSPKYRWPRRGLELSVPTPVSAGAGLEAMHDPVAVSGRHGSARFELALSRDAYTALRSWAEASLPGSGWVT